jgi:hypothetical protein
MKQKCKAGQARPPTATIHRQKSKNHQEIFLASFEKFETSDPGLWTPRKDAPRQGDSE